MGSAAEGAIVGGAAAATGGIGLFFAGAAGNVANQAISKGSVDFGQALVSGVTTAVGGAGFKLGDSLLKKGGQIAGKFLGTAGKEAAAKAGGSVVQKGLKECFKTGFKCGVGATTYDIASQVASGKGLTDIDWKEVGASAAIGLGLGMAAKALSNSKVGQKVDETQVKIGEKLKSTGVKSLEKAGDKLVGDYHDSGSGNPGAGKATSGKATEGGAKTDVLANNRAQGKAFEQQEFPNFSRNNTNAEEQITIKTSSGTKTRVDAIGLGENGNVVINEFKSSSTAPLTPNQKIAFPELFSGGGTVVGKGKGIFTGGYQIPSGTEVKVIRPQTR